jgi:hypothetical protein
MTDHRCRGLNRPWLDYIGGTHICRSPLHTSFFEGPFSSLAASVKFVDLRTSLPMFRFQAFPATYIFAGEKRGTPLNLINLARRVVIPALKTRGVPWKGWHEFRRGFGSNLY